MKLKLCNVNIGGMNEHFQQFTLEGYAFHSLLQPRSASMSIYTPEMAARDNRTMRSNAFTTFDGRQERAIIHRNRRRYSSPTNFRRAPLLTDVLLIGSILTASNWAQSSRRYQDNDFPVTPTNHLRVVSHNGAELVDDTTLIFAKLRDANWCQQYNFGFQIRMLFNTSNIVVVEQRFLANYVIWEYLYARIFGREENNLHIITKALLELYWPNLVNQQIFASHRINNLSSNIFYVLRNQLAHNGRLPIDRQYAEQWMKALPEARQYGTVDPGVHEYMEFFQDFTQVLVFKTLGLDIEARLSLWNFQEHLQMFLSTGRL